MIFSFFQNVNGKVSGSRFGRSVRRMYVSYIWTGTRSKESVRRLSADRFFSCRARTRPSTEFNLPCQTKFGKIPEVYSTIAVAVVIDVAAFGAGISIEPIVSNYLQVGQINIAVAVEVRHGGPA
jgi:hypothetical protein